MKSRSVAIALALAAGGTMLGGPALAAEPRLVSPSSAEVRRFPIERAGAIALTLREAQPLTRFDVAVPHRWSAAGVSLQLRWVGSSLLPKGSTLRVALEGRPWAVAELRPGPGSLTVDTEPILAPRHRLVLEIHVTFASRTPGGASFVRIDRTSPVALTGVPGPAPLLSDLPGSLVERAGDVVPSLVVALPASPSAQAIEAASVVAGAVARETGFPGTTVRTTIGATDQQLGRMRGALIRIDDGDAGDSIRVRRRVNGETELILAGTGRRVIDAAWAVVVQAHVLEGDRVVVAGSVKPPPAPRASNVYRFAPTAAEGPGPMEIRLPFRVPTDLVVERASLRVELAFDMPAGGRVSFRANGRAVAAKRLPAEGKGRTSFTAQLERSDVRPGDNTIEVIATTSSEGEELLASRLDVVQGSRVEIRSHPRVQPALDFWPFLTPGDPSWSKTVVSLPSGPSAEEIAAVIAMLAEAARWTARPLRFHVVFDASVSSGKSLVALVRDPAAAASVGADDASPGMLMVQRRGARTVVVAVGPRALAPLGFGYYAGRVRGSAIVVDARGMPHLVATAPREPIPGSRWWLPLGVVVALLLVAFGIGFGRARRRSALVIEFDVPAAGAAPIPSFRVGGMATQPLDREAALEDWLHLKERHADGEP